MKEQVEKTLQEVFTRHADRRVNVFRVKVESADAGLVKLRGTVLEQENLRELRDELARSLPESVRVDDSAVRVLRQAPGVYRGVATNLTDLHVEPSFLSEMLTQVFNGWRLEVLEEQDKWCYVRQDDGYVGWAYAPYLGDVSQAAPTHVVGVPVAHVFAEQAVGPVPVTRLLAGTALAVSETKGEWARVEPAGGGMLRAGWVKAGELRAISALKALSPAEARRQMVADARALVGTYYLWGGSSPLGIDCSGLSQLVHRMAGVALPRDADMQFTAGRPVEQPLAAGDLVFFHSEKSKEKITHVGISTGGWNMIHSSRSRNGVYEEDVQANDSLRNFVAGARAFVPRA